MQPNADTIAPSPTSDLPTHPSVLSQELKEILERVHGVQFSIIDGQTGNMLYTAPGQPARDWDSRLEICREVARRGQPEFIDDETPLLTLALPLVDALGNSKVAVVTFLTRNVYRGEDLSPLSRLLGMSIAEIEAWMRSQTPWPPELLKRVSDLVLDYANANERAMELRQEANNLSLNLASTYEEINLLHRLTQKLKLSESDEDLGRMALMWMKEVVPAAGLMLQLMPCPATGDSIGRAGRSKPLLLSYGESIINNEQFSALISHLKPQPPYEPIILHRAMTSKRDWPFPQIKELIVVALSKDDTVFGWLAAINHISRGELGTIEASLLSSVAAILGIHGGNIELYRQQSELLAGIIRALTSAIDAKDPYTCGHSDRVAHVAVRLAQELGCDEKTCQTLYLAGLLHDIGKIGVDDGVLRKADKLDEGEYKHIKQHVQIGHRILNDLAKLEDVLPVVLYHHEAWNGNGYPHKLDSERIPLPARIVAVADAFDAMSSDRPYRKGMPDEQVDRILREGAGKQWDPTVIDAYFRVRDDIRRICREEQPRKPTLTGLP
jgi:putative nucleotidyltransferase with HDIG domain